LKKLEQMVGNNSDNPGNGKLPMASRWTAKKPPWSKSEQMESATLLLVGEDEEDAID